MVNITDLIGFSELCVLISVDMLQIDRIVFCSSLKKQISLKNSELCPFSSMPGLANKTVCFGILFAKEGKSDNNTAN